MNLGSTYAVQGIWEKALEHFRRSTELAPQEPLYHFQLATLYEAMGRDEQAEKSFKKALSLFSFLIKFFKVYGHFGNSRPNPCLNSFKLSATNFVERRCFVTAHIFRKFVHLVGRNV